MDNRAIPAACRPCSGITGAGAIVIFECVTIILSIEISSEEVDIIQ